MAATEGPRVADPVNGRAIQRALTARRWILLTTLGESLGFAIPAIAAWLVFMATTGRGEAVFATVLLIALVPAGFGEGAVLGWFQGHAIKGRLPRLSRRRMAVATGMAAAFAYLVSLLVPSLAAWGIDVPILAMAFFALLLGLPALVGIGIAQAWVLRPHVDRPWSHALGTTLGWALAVPLSILMISIVPNDWPIAVHVVVGVLAGVAMGAVVGVVSWPFLKHVVRP